MKKLEDLTYIEYTALQTSGALKVVYPQATGVYSVDCQKSEKDDLMKVEQNDIEKSKEIKPSSPSHPKNLYGSATSMTTNWDW